MKISQEVRDFFQQQNFVIVSTIDSQGNIHSSAKGILEIQEDKLYLADAYRAVTFSNLKRNPKVTVTSIDERHFKGFCIKGKASVIERGQLDQQTLTKWEERLIQRISQRLIKNVQEEKITSHHPEAKLPKLQYLIVIDFEQIVDLTPQHLKQGKKDGFK